MKRKRLLLFIPLAILLTSCNIEIKTSEFTDKLIPNWVSFLVQLGALIVLIAVIMIFAYKPIKKLVKKRQDYIDANIKEAEESKAKWQENENASKEKIIATNKKADEIIEDAKKQAVLEKNKILEETQNEVLKMKQDAKEDIQRMEAQAQDDIKKEIVNVAMAASKELLGREVNSEDNSRLVKEFVEEAKK